MHGKIHIGTSGWHYKHWLGTFYPEGTKAKSQFAEYLKSFDTVELNNSFYRLPDRSTFVNWSMAVKDGFVFSVKASRFITHMKKLKDVGDSVTAFIEHASGLGANLGPILFQLPPLWKPNLQRLEEFLKVLPTGQRFTMEFRQQDWYQPGVFELLRKYNCAFCIYELDGHFSPLEVTADFVYVRLHGPGRKYQGSYSEDVLQEWSARCKVWAQDRDVYVYFDNDEQGFAGFNARRLIELTQN